MKIDDDMVRAAAEAMEAKRAELIHAPIARIYPELSRAALEAAFGKMWLAGDDIYKPDGDVLGFWKSKIPGETGEFDVTSFDGEVWVNPDHDDDPFRAPDFVALLPSPPVGTEG